MEMQFIQNLWNYKNERGIRMLNESMRKKLNVQGESYIHKLNEHEWTWTKLVLSILLLLWLLLW